MDVDEEQEVLLLTYPFGTQHDDNGGNPKQFENVNDINLGADDQWWVDNEYVIQNLESHTLSKKIKESDDNVNDKELGDKDDGYLEDGYESNDSVTDVEALTDDEEYISNKVRAQETKRKKAMINVVTVDYDKENGEDGNARVDTEVEDDVNPGNGINEGIDEENAGNEGDAYFFDLGGGFKQWKCPDDDQLISDSDIDPRSSSDEDDWIKHPRHKRVREVKFNPKIDIKEFDFCVEMIFENPEQLKDQIRAYAACHGYAIWFSKNDKQRIQAKCTGCPWSLWASYEGKNATFKIKSYQKNHVCPAKTSLRAVNSKWLAKVLGDKIRENPFMKLINVKNMVKRDVGREVNLKLCFRTKERALNEVRHSLKDHYSKLWNYVYELGRSNPGSIIVLKGTGDEWCGPPVFRRFYMCFDVVKRGFVNGCRKFVGVDGCFSKTWIKGELLVAMGKDANNHMLKPLNGMHLWPQTDKPVLLPPAPRVLKGRPKWMRRKDAFEDGKGKPTHEIPVALPQLDEEDPYKVVKKSKKGMKMTCRHCRKEGHNIRKCPDRPVQNDVPEGQSGETATGTQIPTQKREKHPVRRKKDFRYESATLGEKNNKDGSTSATGGCGRQGQVPKNAASGVNIKASASVLQPSFTKRTTSFITPEHLLQQSRAKKKISRGSF